MKFTIELDDWTRTKRLLGARSVPHRFASVCQELPAGSSKEGLAKRLAKLIPRFRCAWSCIHIERMQKNAVLADRMRPIPSVRKNSGTMCASTTTCNFARVGMPRV